MPQSKSLLNPDKGKQMKRFLSICFLLYLVQICYAQTELVLPYNATGLTDEQKAMNPDRLAYPKSMKETIRNEVDFLCNTKITEFGPFSVSARKKVVFAPGNLQFCAGRGTHVCADGAKEKGMWRFAEHQWDYVGGEECGTVYANGEKCNNSLISDNYAGWIDLFGWGTSGWKSGAMAFVPYSTSAKNEDYYPGNSYTTDLTAEFAYADWGKYNQIGTDPAGTWRTLTQSEWQYLVFKRPNYAELQGYAFVNGIGGMVLLPDTWSLPDGLSFSHLKTNNYTVSQWSVMEEGGAVFLPAADRRDGNQWSYCGLVGFYWTASHTDQGRSHLVIFTEDEHINLLDECEFRSYGLAVRLAKDITPAFSVSENKRVLFSPGNLQYCAGTNTWRFAEHQWDFVGDAESGTVYANGEKCNNALISATYSGWIDLFGWGTSGWNSGAKAYQPYSTSRDSTDYFVGNNKNNSLTGEYANADWAVYNKIGNDPAGTWRTLTYEEWEYMLNKRPNYAQLRGLATVNDVPGCVLLPDNWSTPSGITFSVISNSSFSDNVYNAAQWEKMENAGAVFLPAAGNRISSILFDVSEWGTYWTASVNPNPTEYKDRVWCFSFYDNAYPHIWGRQYRHFGSSVRPVQDIK